MRALQTRRELPDVQRRAISVVLIAGTVVAASLLLGTLFEALGASAIDAADTAVSITGIAVGLLNFVRVEPGERSRWWRWLAARAPLARISIRVVLVAAVGALLFSLDVTLGMSRGWALGIAGFFVVAVSVSSIVRRGRHNAAAAG